MKFIYLDSPHSDGKDLAQPKPQAVKGTPNRPQGEDYRSRPPANEYERALRILDSRGGAHYRVARSRFLREAGGTAVVRDLIAKGYLRTERDDRGDAYFRMTSKGADGLIAGTIR